MIPLKFPTLNLGSAVVLIFTLGLWAMLWFSLHPGNPANILNPGSSIAYLHVLRGFFPFIAAWIAVILILAKLSQIQPRGFRFFGPLGLATVYGVIGIMASILSPNSPLALYWAASYLSVPVVLWGATWGGDSLDWVRRLVYLNWVVIIMAVVALSIVWLVYLGYARAAIDPHSYVTCNWGEDWLKFTSGALRTTGAGRYAALALVIALSLLWRGKWRGLWVSVLIASLMLLIATNARASIAGLSVAVPVVILLHGGKKAAIGGAIALSILMPILWASGISETFLRNCILTPWSAERASTLNLRSPGPIPTPTQTPPDQPAVAPTAHSSTLEPGNQAEPDPSQKAAAEAPTPPAISPPGEPAPPEEPSQKPKSSFIPAGFYTFSGRTVVWETGWEFVKQSPFLGYGFHADRLVLGTHMHNAILHSLLQTGFIGALAFIGTFVYGAVLSFRLLKNLSYLPPVHKQMVVQTAGIMVLLSIRSVWESTGAFFGVDWLILAPLLLYLQILDSTRPQMERTS